ncbi:hypothetical protein [Streptomyces lavendulae]|uniref:hypothetical protein n=1 Tax=Streptomyces lavendulae TaxID=1914 RepID=UPI0024A267C4|nr:hypothetical protein [Streptomyces lavendulae]GLX18929.1 hypothetical protein Slala01_25730 [Streptomyces lavendulae subsp. lavendulae]GLX29149.1 hypothetical protein Slala02_49690 [Streptomyces lavendulae subsp. lavendulae]
MAREELTRLTGNGNGNGGPCGQGDCPHVYRSASGSIIVQGDLSEAFIPPAGEGLVEIPESVLREAVRALGW